MRYRDTTEKSKFKRALVRLAIGAAVAASFGSTVAGAVEPAREAHDTYCIACHTTSVYTRDDRLARDYESVRAQVDRWQGNISLGWSKEEIDRMAKWLAENYYRIPCPDMC